MGIKKNRVFDDQQLQILMNKTKELMIKGEEILDDLYLELGKVSENLKKLPSDVCDRNLLQRVESLRETINQSIKNKEFSSYQQKIVKSINELSKNVFIEDKKLSIKVNTVAQTVRLMSIRIKTLTNMITTGIDDKYYKDFAAKLESCMQVWDNMNVDIQAILKKIRASLKGGKNTAVCYGGDPVNLSTGNFIYKLTDISIRGTTPLELCRFYNEIDLRVGIFGKGWRTPYDVNLVVENENYIVILEDSKEEFFIQKEDGSFYGESAVGRLQQLGNRYLYTDFNGKQYEFNQEGQCVIYGEDQGDIFHLEYQDGRLTKVIRKEDQAYLAFRYNAKGRIIEVYDHSGRHCTFQYNEEGDLIYATNPQNERVEYSYDTAGHLSAIVDATGVMALYNEYDEQDRTVLQRFPDGGEITYEYDDEHNRVVMTERNGSKTILYHNEEYQSVRNVYEDGEEQFGYDKRGLRTFHKDCNGNITRYAYDNRGNMTQVISPSGVKRNFTFDSRDKLIQASINGKVLLHNTYDSNGRLLATKNAVGGTIQFHYNEKGILQEIVKEDGSIVGVSYDDKGNIVEVTDPYGYRNVYEYDTLNRVVAVRNAAGRTYQYTYDNMGRLLSQQDPLGQVTKMQYNGNGKPVLIRHHDGGAVSIEYNALGKESAIINKAGHRVELTYNSSGAVEQLLYPDGAKEQYQYDCRGRVSSIKDAIGAAFEYEYDPNGNLILEKSPNGEVTRYQYNAENQVECIIDCEGNKEYFCYNDMGILIKHIDALEHVESFEYDAQGRKISETNVLGETITYTYTSLGNIATITGPNGKTCSYEYALGGRLSAIHYSDSTRETFSYDELGNLVRKKDRQGNDFFYQYDALGRLTSVQGTNGEHKTFQYDSNNNITAITDANGNTMTYLYSITGKLIQVTDAFGNDTIYEYDIMDRLIRIRQNGNTNHITEYKRTLRGQVETVTDALGCKEHYSYDANGQLIEKIDKEGYVTTYRYTPKGNLNYIHYADNREVQLTYNPLSQLVQIQDWLGVTSFENDALGRVTKTTYPDGRSVQYTIGAYGERRSIVYPNGNAVFYQYDEALRLSQIQDGDRTINYRYDEAGRQVEKEYPNHARSTYQYNEQGRLSELILSDRDGVIDDYRYYYDQLGNQIGIDKLRRGLEQENGHWDYQYDQANRLIQVSRDGQLLRSYSYDEFGNRVAKKELGRTIKYQYNSVNQLISQKNEDSFTTDIQSYQYDNRGNLIAMSTNGILEKEYVYGPLNRLEQVRDADGAIAGYEYDGLGHRIAKQLNPETRIQYTVDLTKGYHNLLEMSGGVETEIFLWDQNVIGSSGLDSIHYYAQDNLGSVSRVMDEVGELLDSYGYDEFGMDLYGNQGLIQPFGYTGYQFDSVANSYFAQAREYLPQIGRFAGEDKIQGRIDLPDTLNTYTYCWNNPLNLVDLNGLLPEDYDYLEGGREAHTLLQTKFLADFGGRGGAVEFSVNSGYPLSQTGKGRADIVYFNAITKTVEVYEIKPGSYAPNAVNYQDGIDQLDGYIDALSVNGQINKKWMVMPGRTLNGYFNNIVLPSVLYPDYEIVYSVYQNGLINYYYRRRRRQEEPKPVPAPEPHRVPVTEKKPEPEPVPGPAPAPTPVPVPNSSYNGGIDGEDVGNAILAGAAVYVGWKLLKGVAGFFVAGPPGAVVGFCTP